MILDGHIHVTGKAADVPGLVTGMKVAGIDGGIIISKEPNSFCYFEGRHEDTSASENLENLMSWTKDQPNLYPFYWIDPMEEDALEQIDMAATKNVAGFKVICNRFYPGDPRAMEVYRAIASHHKPILFHSGIMWDAQASSMYNHPAEFEALLDVSGLKFALAHISWPWCDECIAVFGKFLNAYSSRPNLSCEMFIDLTPGTPPIYREDALTKLFSVGYEIENNVIFGTDCLADDYRGKWARELTDRDADIYRKLGLSTDQVEKVFSGNLKRFLGLTSENIAKNM